MDIDTPHTPLDKHTQAMRLEMPKYVIERAVRVLAKHNLHIEGIALVRGAYRHFDGSAASLQEAAEIYKLLTGWQPGGRP